MKLSDLMSMVTDKARQRMLEESVGKDYPEEEQAEIARVVGLAALKFADLSNHRSSDYIFDIDRFTRFEGKTGPYVVYTAVRIKSIFRRVGEPEGVRFAATLADREREVLLLTAQLADIVQAAYDASTPHQLAEQAFVLCQSFNRFYQECNILHEQDQERKQSWLSTCTLVLRQLELLSDLLGMEIPERM